MNTKTKMMRMALQALFGASLLLGANAAFAEGEAKADVSTDGGVDASVGAKRVLHQTSRAAYATCTLALATGYTLRPM